MSTPYALLGSGPLTEGRGPDCPCGEQSLPLFSERSEIGCESTRSVPDLKQKFDTKIFDLLKEFLVRELKIIHIEAFPARRACIDRGSKNFFFSFKINRGGNDIFFP